VGAILVRKHIEALRDAALSKGLRQYLDGIDEEFEGMLDGVDESDVLGTKRRIWEVEWMVGGALELLHMPKEGFRRQGGMIADGLEVALREVSADDMQKVSELVKTIRACLEADAIEGPPRDIAVEAHIVLSDILFSRERDEQEEDQSTNEASFREMTSAAYELIREGYPEVAVEAAGDMTENAPLAGAALLDAAFRHRLRDSSSSFLADIAPVLKRTRITAVAAKGSGAMHEFGEHLMAKKFPKAISEGAPVHLEFGGGLESYGLERADDRVADRWISIDPDVEAMRIYLETADELPKNFVPVTGRAEESAPFAANEPFAEDAVMVAPSRNGLDAMILSALLAVKPGGFVNVYMDAEIKNDLKWLEKTGFLVRDERISPGDPTLPPSGRLEGYSEVRHVRVAVGGLKGDGTDPTRSGRGDFDGAMRAMDASGPAAESGGGPKKSLGAVDEVSELDSWRRKHASVGPVSVMSLGLATWMGVLKAV